MYTLFSVTTHPVFTITTFFVFDNFHTFAITRLLQTVPRYHVQLTYSVLKRFRKTKKLKENNINSMVSTEGSWRNN